jgi:hypothetical protein
MTQQSKLEQFLNNTKPGGQPQSNARLKDALEEELAQEDTALASDLRRTRAEEIIATRRKKISIMTGENGQSAETAARREASVEQSLVEVAQGLLDKGLDPTVVGRMVDYMLGNRQPVGGFGIPGMQPAGQQITISDILNLVDRLNANNKQPQTDPAITQILNKLTDEFNSLKTQVATGFKPTGAIMVQQADGTFLKVADSDHTVVIPRVAPSSDNSRAMSLEEKKLDFQHEEKMGEITAAKERGKALTDALSAIPEKIGEGLAAMAESKGSSAAGRTAAKVSASSQQLPVFRCLTEGCNTDIPVPDGTKKIRCPKCKQEYEGE